MRGLKKVFSTGQNPAGKISSSKSEETKVPTTRASVNMLVQKYLDRSELYPKPTRDEQLAFFDREIRTVFEEKLKGTKVGKSLEDVLKIFTKEVSLLSDNYMALKSIISDVLATIEQNPQGQIAVADINPEQLRPLIVEGHVTRSPSLSDMVDMSGGIRARVASVASDSSLVNSTVEKFSKLVDPDKTTVLDIMRRTALLVGKDVALSVAASSPTIRGFMSQQLSNWTNTIKIEGLFPPTKGLDSSALQQQEYLKKKLTVFLSTTGGNKIEVTENNLARLKNAIAGIETRVGQTPDGSQKLTEEAALLKKIQSECELKLGVRANAPGILDDIIALNKVLPTIQPEDLASPLKLVSKMLVNLRDNPDARVVLRDIMSAASGERLGLRTLLEEVKGHKVVMALELLLTDDAISLCLELIDTLNLGDEGCLKALLTDPVGVLLQDTDVLSNVMDITLRNMPKILNNERSFQLLLQLSRSETLHENRMRLREAGGASVGLPDSDTKRTLAEPSPVAHVLGAAGTLLASKIADNGISSQGAGLNVAGFFQRFEDLVRTTDVTLANVNQLFSDATTQNLADFGAPKTDFEAISNLFNLAEAALSSGTAQLGQRIVTDIVAKEISKMVEKSMNPTAGPREIVILDERKVAQAKTYALMMAADFVGKTPQVVDVVCDFGANLIQTLRSIDSPDQTPLERRDSLVTALQNGIFDIGSTLRSTDSPLANRIADVLLQVKFMLNNRMILETINKSGLFKDDCLTRLKESMMAKSTIMIEKVELDLIRMVTEKLNPPPAASVRVADQSDPVIDHRFQVSLGESMAKKLNGDGFVPKGLLTRNGLYAVGLYVPLTAASNGVLGLVNDLRL